ncbi:hypothetical protein ALC57_14087, partial [Trachymyrmex cornetzi]
IRCPVAAARKIATDGGLVVGWSRYRVDVLFKCLEIGHVRAACSSAMDHSGCCYRCRTPGHMARSCAVEAYCLFCRDAGRGALDHRSGSGAWPLTRSRVRPVMLTGRIPPARDGASPGRGKGGECPHLLGGG